MYSTPTSALDYLDERQLADIGVARIRHSQLAASYFPDRDLSRPAIRTTLVSALWSALTGRRATPAVPPAQHPLTPALKVT